MSLKEMFEKPKCIKCKIVILFTFIVVFTGSDLLVKELAEQKLNKGTETPVDNETITVIDGFWNFHYVTNDDIGFSVLSWVSKYLDKNQKWMLMVALQLIGTAIVTIFFFLTNDFFQLIPLAMVISGALGNVIDRIMRGFVVDYIMWYYNDFVWPIFNLADVYTVIGAVLLFIILIVFGDSTIEKESENEDKIETA